MMMKKCVCLLLTALLCVSCLAGCGSKAADASAEEAADTHKPSIHWRADTTGKYREDDTVDCVICVEATSKNCARVLMYEKSRENGKTVWTNTLACDGVIGLNGLGKTKEGDNMTPLGDFGITEAFGIKENPGTPIPYVDITEDIYCCGDETAYNQLIDIRDYPHDCADGEHMIDYTPEYNYGLFIDYNKEGTPGLGSAIFFHCKGANTYTGGCIAVDEECMIRILQAADANTRIIIDYAPDYAE